MHVRFLRAQHGRGGAPAPAPAPAPEGRRSHHRCFCRTRGRPFGLPLLSACQHQQRHANAPDHLLGLPLPPVLPLSRTVNTFATVSATATATTTATATATATATTRTAGRAPRTASAGLRAAASGWRWWRLPPSCPKCSSTRRCGRCWRTCRPGRARKSQGAPLSAGWGQACVRYRMLYRSVCLLLLCKVCFVCDHVDCVHTRLCLRG